MQCCKSQKKCVEQLSELNQEERAEVFRVVSEMNEMYSSGYRNDSLRKLTNTEGFRVLESLSPCHIQEYIKAMLNDEITNNNILFIPVTN